MKFMNWQIFQLLCTCKGSFGGCQGQPLARPWHLLIRSLGLAVLPPPSVRLSVLGVLPTLLFTISSSSIDSPMIHARLAYSLLYTLAIRLTISGVDIDLDLIVIHLWLLLKQYYNILRTLLAIHPLNDIYIPPTLFSLDDSLLSLDTSLLSQNIIYI